MARTKILISCAFCNNSFRVKPSHRSKRRCCSRQCYNSYRRARFRIRFWARVNKTEECWLWEGPRNHFGYGLFAFARQTLATHRVSFELAYGPIPSPLFVLHKCDNPRCVNPEHLYLGTQLDNMRDRQSRTGYPQGIKHHMAKLTENEVREIRRLYADGTSQISLAEQFNSDQTNISMIVNRKTWRHI